MKRTEVLGMKRTMLLPSLVCLICSGCNTVGHSRLNPHPLTVTLIEESNDADVGHRIFRVTIANHGDKPVYVPLQWTYEAHGSPTLPLLYSNRDGTCVIAWVAPKAAYHELDDTLNVMRIDRIDPGQSLIRRVSLSTPFFENRYHDAAPTTPAEI